MESVLRADVVNLIALAVFAFAVCWRMDQIRRDGGGLQATAMTVSVVAFTLAFVSANTNLAQRLNGWTFDGFSRVLLWSMLALGAGALVVVFYYSPAESGRARRAGIEAVPLTIAAAGLQIAMTQIPHNLRHTDLTGNSARYWAFATFFLIASTYLAYGFSASIGSIRQFMPAAAGYLRVSLILLIGGLAALATASLVQIVFILGAIIGWHELNPLLAAARALALSGLLGFLTGIAYPLLHARVRWIRARLTLRRQYRDLEPLWETVTGAVPAVVLPGHDGEDLKASAMVRFNRRVVEIRDALTQISPLLPHDFEQSSPERQAKLISAACRRYRDDGDAPGEVRDVLPARASTIIGDAEPLREVSITMTRGARWVSN
ncbi:hypothetical protein HUN08_00365 [Gordonia sp. X0973]|uniref:MAB_1171c family putative transporter n=1 Tax=Gordonia sp. X0973 TaxID=2742602 RepID=UPI000F537991|nr:MAB_1171c family putative transporter [Gordonia sp. X0973]QKT05821.1 hypothetical protein HUN08_00365 [Gordonia sp. X0973]